MQENGMKESFENISVMKRQTFKKHVNKKSKNMAFQYLVAQIKSKGQDIEFKQKLECQGYLLPNNIWLYTIKETYSPIVQEWKKLVYNYAETNTEEKCQCGKDMNNIYLYECHVLNHSKRTVKGKVG